VERVDGLSEVVGSPVAVVSMGGGEVGQHDAALFAAVGPESVEGLGEVVGCLNPVSGGESGISGESVQPAHVVEVEPRGR
jgi:hypothetical protein